MVNRPLATSCEILVASAKFLVALATRKVQFQTLSNKIISQMKNSSQMFSKEYHFIPTVCDCHP